MKLRPFFAGGAVRNRALQSCSCCCWLLSCWFVVALIWAAAPTRGEAEINTTTAANAPAAANTSAETAAAVPIPLPLPKDANSSCSKAVFREFSQIYHMCAHAFYHYNINPDKLCCQGLVDFFGMNTSRPSQNCLCVPAVMNRLTAGYDHHCIEFEKSFKYCRLKFGLVVPFYQAGGLGYCNGTQDDPVDITEVDVTFFKSHKRKSFANWVSRLDRDWLMLASFISSIVSVPGFLTFLWPFVYDFVRMMREAHGK